MTNKLRWPADEPIPEEHCRVAEDAYRAACALARGSPELEDMETVASFEPLLLDLDDEVYATVHDLLAHNRQLLSSSRELFRGHADAEWQLLPSRRRFRTRQAMTLLAKCGREFREQVASLLPEASNDEVEALCQHYGIPTDLLDVTTSIEVAAHFARQSDSGEVACIWVFDRNALDTAGLWVNPKQTAGFNPRLMRQRGSFVRVPDGEFDATIRESARCLRFGGLAIRRGALESEDGLLTSRRLFPPDEEDAIALAAKPIVSKLRDRQRLIAALEASLRGLDHTDRELVHSQVDEAIGFGSEVAFVDRLKACDITGGSLAYLALEEIAWGGTPCHMERFLELTGPLWTNIAAPYLFGQIEKEAVRRWAAQDWKGDPSPIRSCLRLAEQLVRDSLPIDAVDLLNIFANPNNLVFASSFDDLRARVADALPGVQHSQRGWLTQPVTRWRFNETSPRIIHKLTEFS